MRILWLAPLYLLACLLLLLVTDETARLVIYLLLLAISVAAAVASYKAKVGIKESMARMNAAVESLLAERHEKPPRA